MTFPNWNDRPEHADQGQPQQGVLDSAGFLRNADQFISLANKRNRKVAATDLQMVMLYAAARYAAHVGKNVLELDDQEEFVSHMTAQYTDMLRQHMADPTV